MSKNGTTMYRKMFLILSKATMTEASVLLYYKNSLIKFFI